MSNETEDIFIRPRTQKLLTWNRRGGLFPKIAFLGKKSQGLNKYLAFFLIFALEGLIFGIDIDKNPMISVSPYFLFPIILSAWLLDEFSTFFFALLSTVFRVYGFRRTFPGTFELFYEYNICLTGAVYLSFALLALKNRQLILKFAKHSELIKLRAKQISKTARLERTVRRALPGDVEGIVKLIVSATRDGVFPSELLAIERQKSLKAAMKKNISEGRGPRVTWDDKNENVLIDYWVSEINGNLAGYMMIMGWNETNETDRELHAIVVANAYRNLGVGSALTDFFCKHYKNRRLVVACKPNSRMIKMIEHRNFIPFSTAHGYVLLEQLPSR